MKKLTTQEVVSLVGIAIAAPVLTLAILVSARVASVAENDFLLFALALGGVVVSAKNGFGRTVKAQLRSASGRKGQQPKVALPS